MAELSSKLFNKRLVLFLEDRIRKGSRKTSPGPGKLIGGNAEIKNNNDKTTDTRVTIHVALFYVCHLNSDKLTLQK